MLSSNPTRMCPPMAQASVVRGSWLLPIPVTVHGPGRGRLCSMASRFSGLAGIPPRTPITKLYSGGLSSSPWSSSRPAVASIPRALVSSSGRMPSACIRLASALMRSGWLSKISSPKFRLPQFRLAISGRASNTRMRSSWCMPTCAPVDIPITMSHRSRMRSAMRCSTMGSVVGRPSSSRAWMWTTAAPSSAERATSAAISSGVTGRCGFCSLVTSAPVGATVMTTGSAGQLTCSLTFHDVSWSNDLYIGPGSHRCGDVASRTHDPAEVEVECPQGSVMRLLVIVGGTLIHDRAGEPAVGRVAGGGFDAAVGRDARDHQAAHAEFPQYQLKVGAVECAERGLADDGFAWLWFDLAADGIGRVARPEDVGYPAFPLQLPDPPPQPLRDVAQVSVARSQREIHDLHARAPPEREQLGDCWDDKFLVAAVEVVHAARLELVQCEVEALIGRRVVVLHVHHDERRTFWAQRHWLHEGPAVVEETACRHPAPPAGSFLSPGGSWPRSVRNTRWLLCSVPSPSAPGASSRGSQENCSRARTAERMRLARTVADCCASTSSGTGGTGAGPLSSSANAPCPGATSSSTASTAWGNTFTPRTMNMESARPSSRIRGVRRPQRHPLSSTRITSPDR